MKIKLFGITFYVSLFFAGLFAIILLNDKTGTALPLILAVFAHETGHLAAIIYFNKKPQAIYLRACAVEISGYTATCNKEDFIIYLMGPISNLLLFGLMYFIYFVFNTEWFLTFSIVNLILFAVNILPVKMLDGGDLLNIFLTAFTGGKYKNFIISIISFITLLLLLIFGIYLFLKTKSITVIIFALYLIITALINKDV